MTQGCKTIASLCIAVVLCLTNKIASAQSLMIDLRTAITTALENNDALRADSLSIVVAEYQKRELQGWFLPQVNYSSRLNYNRKIGTQMLPGAIAGQPSKDFVPVQFGTKYDVAGTVEVSQNIWRRDLFSMVKSSAIQKEIAVTNYALSKEELVYQVAAAYFGLQSKAELIRTTRNDYSNLTKILEITKAQFAEGTVKRLDFESLQISVANKLSQLNQLETQYNEQLDYFKYFLGVSASTAIVISDKVTFLPDIPATQRNLSTRTDLVLNQQFIDLKESELKTKKAEGLPVLSAYLRHAYQSQFNNTRKVFDNDYWFESSSVGITVSVPLFDGNRRRNLVRSIQHEIHQLKLQGNRKYLLATTEQSAAARTYDNNRRQYHTNETNLQLAEKVFTSRSSLYGEGVSTLLELLDAEKELSQARNLYIQSLIEVQRGQLDLYKANGLLLTDLLKPLQ